MTGRRIKIVSTILVCSLLSGCTGLTLGPVIERKAIIVRSGTAIECLDQTTVEARLLKDEGSVETFRQDIGGWIMLHPDHWESFKKEYKRLQIKAGEAKAPEEKK